MDFGNDKYLTRFDPDWQYHLDRKRMKYAQITKRIEELIAQELENIKICYKLKITWEPA